MAEIPVVRLVKGDDAVVVNVGSADESTYRARGYAEPGSEPPEPVRPEPVVVRRNGGGRSRARTEAAADDES